MNNISLEWPRCAQVIEKADSRLPPGSAENIFWIPLQALGAA
jgi:hypothetical protein